MKRKLAYVWIHVVQALTACLPDVIPVLRLRGWLIGISLKRCGRDFQVAGGVAFNYPTEIEVGNHVYVARGCWLHASGGIVLADEVQLGPYVVLITGDHALENGSYRYAIGRRSPIRIGRGAWIGAHATLLRGTTVGEAAVVAANALASGEIPAYTVVGGVPAKVIKTVDAATKSRPEGGPVV